MFDEAAIKPSSTNIATIKTSLSSLLTKTLKSAFVSVELKLKRKVLNLLFQDRGNYFNLYKL